jgi:hypothetical protein
MLPRSGDDLKDVMFGEDTIRPGHTGHNRGKASGSCV